MQKSEKYEENKHLNYQNKEALLRFHKNVVFSKAVVLLWFAAAWFL